MDPTEYAPSDQSPGPSTEKSPLSLKSSISSTKKKPHGWDNIRDYMSAKESKRQSQFHTMGQRLSAIFSGVIIYVNGYTEPSADQLKTLIHDHGGMYSYYYAPSKVTHMIADNLPDTKVKNLSRDTVVCSARWIVDSVAAGKLLPVLKYRLYHQPSEQGLLSFDSRGKGKGLASKKAKFEELHVAASCGENSAPKQLVAKPSQAGAANIISEFYAHSRLHYLSMWSTELKEFTTRMRSCVKPRMPKLPVKHSPRIFVHIDLDCFFVSVGLRERPYLREKPVAVSHSKASTAKDFTGQGKKSTESMSDIASCNYKARELGVHNGMSVGKALQKCPNLVLIPYEFENYRRVSQTLYETLLSCVPDVEAVSCDEAYMELTHYVASSTDACTIVEELREEIYGKTGCNASAGIAHNMLLARLCTRIAKPCGQFYLPEEVVLEFLSSQPVSSLPGVGRSLSSRLDDALGITNCHQLREASVSKLQMEFGKKLGTNLYNNARGVDDRCLTLESERKSLSADVNFAIRFQTQLDADDFIANLAQEVERRAVESKIVGKMVTLKLKVRKANAPIESAKYLGHGICDSLSKSTHLPMATSAATVIESTCKQLLQQFNVKVTDIRGMGIQLTKLDTVESKNEFADLREMFTVTKEPAEYLKDRLTKPCSTPSALDETFEIPSASQLDSSVFAALPDHYKAKINARHAKDRKSLLLHPTTSSAEVGIRFTDANTRTTASMRDATDKDTTRVFAYLTSWLQHSADGPTDHDLRLFTDYVTKMLDDHLDFVHCILKYLRRKIASLQLDSWKSAFLQLLTSVQYRMEERYNAPLNLCNVQT